MATSFNNQRSMHRGLNRFCTNQTDTPTMKLIETSRYATGYKNTNHIISDRYQEEFFGKDPSSLTFWESCRTIFGADIENEKVQKWATNLEDLIDLIFPIRNTLYLEACRLLHEYKSKRKADYLFRLYTLDTRIGQAFSSDEKKLQAFLEPIIYKLPTMSSRFFEGYCYRGLVMEAKDLALYEWASGKKGQTHLATNTFWSTSIDEAVARCFASLDNPIKKGQIRVLMQFHFPYQCSTAIAIFKEPSLSHFADEQEVLILPGTFIRVVSINFSSDQSVHKIHLECLDTREELDEMRRFVVQNRVDDWIENTID